MKKGVFFTVIMVLFLFVLSMSLTKWSQGVKMNEYRVSRHVYLDSVVTASQILSDDNIEKITIISARHALFKLANHTSEDEFTKINPSSSETFVDYCHGVENRDTCSVSDALGLLMYNGSVPSSYFNGGPEYKYSDEDIMYTLNYFNKSAIEVCNAIGWVCYLSEPYDISIQQINPFDVEFNYTINKTIQDSTSDFQVNQFPINISVVIPVDGMPDPLTTHLMRQNAFSATGDHMRLIYRDPGTITTNWFKTVEVVDNPGKGFVYGAITSDWNLDSTSSHRYIFVGKNDGLKNIILSGSTLDKFGGYIIEKVERKDIDTYAGNEIVHVSHTCADPVTIECSIDYYDTISYEENCVIDCINITETYGRLDININYPIPLACAGLQNEISSLCRTQFFNTHTSRKEYVVENVYDVPYIKLDSAFDPATLDLNYPSNHLYDADDYYPGTPNHGILINTQNSANSSEWDLEDGTYDYLSSFEDVYDLLNAHPNAHRLHNIEPLRDMAICGFFTVDTRAPSFFQRMVSEGDRKASDDYGIYSFAVGKWAIDDTDPTEVWSSVDFEYHKCYRGSSCEYARVIKGMPGCKDYKMCAITDITFNPNVDGVGQVAVDTEFGKNVFGIWDQFVCEKDHMTDCY
ncbi:hypothetical protein KO465_01205 [Candidatus Micrarchaeota archaeon]|nr:hypothetical protein [Candidatus Micrarchaeota archaeon]